MKLAISNLAWDNADLDHILPILFQTGVKGLEVAPTKIWGNPLVQDPRDIQAFRQEWILRGIEVISLQSVLYDQPRLQIFRDEDSREKLKGYLSDMMRLASEVGATTVVFGSPKNRVVGSMDLTEARDIAFDFFYNMGDVASQHGIALCIEPNPTAYGTDFLVDLPQTLDFVRGLNHPAVKINLDTGAMILNRESPEKVLESCLPYVGHLHVSEPFLDVVGRNHNEHKMISAMLTQWGYHGWASIEMKSGALASNVVAVERAVNFVLEAYIIA